MKKLTLLFAAMIFISYISIAQTHHFKFKIENKSELNKITRIISIDNFENGYVHAYANDKEFAEFSKLNYKIEELPLFDNSPKVITMATTRAQMANWDRYPTYDVYVEMMNYYATTYPTICQIINLGTSVDGRQILSLRISDNITQNEQEPEFFYTSSMHGDEITGYVLMLRLADYLLTNYGSNTEVNNLVDNFDIYINPASNPDGTYAGGNSTVSSATRYNANGIDLNRDFPDPRSVNSPYAQETQLMMNFATAHNFVMSANFHGGIELANYAWDTWTEGSPDYHPHPDRDWWFKLSTDYAASCQTNSPSGYFTGENNGVTNGGDWYVVIGGRQDYMNYFHHCRELTLEISDTKLLSTDMLPEYWDYNKQAMLNYIKEAKYGFNGTVKNIGGEPLNAKIEIIGHDQDNTRVITDPAIGDYYRPIAPGTYSVQYSSEGYISQTHSVTVSGWITTTIKDVVLLQADQIALSGTVTDALTGLPIENAKISFLNTSISDIFTNTAGEYSTTIAENSYDIKVYKTGYSPITVTETVSAENNNINFVLIPSEAITFEDNIPAEFTFPETIDWTRSSDYTYEGTYSMKSGNISDSQTTTMLLTTTTQAGSISFYKKVSSEAGWDFLFFYIDGIEKGNWSGEIDWSQETFTITAGQHEFKWSYIKDSNTSDFDDCAWVDFIELPMTQVTAYTVNFAIKEQGSLAPIAGASVNLSGYGTKTADASGIAVFTDVFETTGENTINYTVNADGYNQTAGSLQVTADVDEIVEMILTPADINALETDFIIFPNPSNGNALIKSNTIIEQITIIDISGKIIQQNQVNSTQFNIENPTKGIYFVSIQTKNNKITKKLIVN